MMTDAILQSELQRLKDFQRRTVDYVFRRFYEDDPPARRFLVADEVGLGKTLVARGVIAKAIHHLQDKVRRVDIIYVCSNAAIANQNLQRLNILRDQRATFATRLTLLPTQLASLEENRINFVSFTPGTTFDLKSRGGKMEERALLYRMLDGHFDLRPVQLRNVLQATASDAGWDRHLSWATHPISEPLADRFRTWLAGSPHLEQLREVCSRFARRRKETPADDWHLQYSIIGALRQGLAKQCVTALEPDVVVIDEFQRFKHLLHGEDEAAELAKQLFDHEGLRVLLLSATPYRMLTMSHEADENHHADFLETVRFLADDGGMTAEQLQSRLADLRRALLSSSSEQNERVARERKEIERILRRVMSRTERIASTRARDAMLSERRLRATLTKQDVARAVELDGVSRLLGSGDPIEYWKSAPYLLSFMEGYELRSRLSGRRTKDATELETLRAGLPSTLQKEQFERYEALDPANPRMRALLRDTIEAGTWRLLWLPPSVPYIAPTGPYAGIAPAAATKALVFSSWHVVPRAIAAMLSYEAERRMVTSHEGNASYERLGRTRRPLLTFRVDADGRPTGMPALALMYPSATLAGHVDPLELALELGNGQPAPLEALREHIAARVQPLVDRIVKHHSSDAAGAVDQRWYWAIPALLDYQHNRAAFDWLVGDEGLCAVLGEDEEGDAPDLHEEEDAPDGVTQHVVELGRIVRAEERLGRVPEDLGRVVADFALASPAVCAARALLRVSRLSRAEDVHVLGAAAHVASGFRTLFNVPESISLLRGDSDPKPYWRRVLEYCVDGNLQAVLDEYAHLLVENTGCIGAEGEVIADRVSRAMESALSPRTANLVVDEVKVVEGKVAIDGFRVRCRFALRFGDVRDDEGSTVARAETVRDAFNSPFRPFVLASTSIGQEGLDFHSYCHAVYHWNLPSNPVDLEQREGRVNRYKGHAIRRNVARRYGLSALARHWSVGDPWERMFALAVADRPTGASDLVPYWVFEAEGGVSVERRIPLLPLSREVAQIDVLKRNLAVYRLAFGQPRQDDLMAYLVSMNLSPESIDAWRVSLEPGASE